MCVWWVSNMCGMTGGCMCHGAVTGEPWLNCLCVMPHSRWVVRTGQHELASHDSLIHLGSTSSYGTSHWCIYHDALMCVTMTHWCVWPCWCVMSWFNSRMSYLIGLCTMTHWCVWHDSVMCVSLPWRIDTFGQRKLVCHIPFICVPWLIHPCTMTHWSVYHDSLTCVRSLVDVCAMIHLCSMTHWCVWHDSVLCVSLPWRNYVCVIAVAFRVRGSANWRAKHWKTLTRCNTLHTHCTTLQQLPLACGAAQTGAPNAGRRYRLWPYTQ